MLTGIDDAHTDSDRPGGAFPQVRRHFVRMSHFWTLMDDEFGAEYAGSLARDHVLGALGNRTVRQALADGESPRVVWEALCDDMDVPAERRLGRSTRVARGAQGGQVAGR
jgi:hypothetical protein